MTGFDPYLVLGVDRLALAPAIKAAYRRKVQTAHPDRGGATEDFIAIVKAFGVLSDAEARRRYDETGIIDDDGVKNYRQDVLVILADMFDTAVQSAVSSGLPLSSVNFVSLMTSAVDTNIADLTEDATRIHGEVEALIALRKRIRRNDSESNIFVERLDVQIKAKTEEHSMVLKRVKVLETAKVELGNYESEVELISALQTGS